MSIDIVCIVVLVLFFIYGYRTGIIVALLSVAALVLGLVCALKCSETFSNWLLARGYVSSGWVQVVSYVVLFIGVVFIVRLLARLVQKLAEGLWLGTLNRILGGLLFVLVSLAILSSFVWIAARMNLLSQQTIAASRTYPYLSALAPWLFALVGHLIPFVKDTFEKLGHFFDAVNHKISAP